MQYRFSSSVMLLLTVLSGQLFASIDIIKPSTPGTKNTLPYREGRLLVKTVDDFPEDALIATANEIGAVAVESYSIVPGLWLYEFDESIDVEDAKATFHANELVEYAEPDYYYEAAVQDDPRYPEQWSLENSGQSGGTPDADINAESMWAIEEGDGSLVIGIIDSGVDYNHQDLTPNLWTNSLEIPGNGIDDDANGYVDDIYGINAIANNGNPLDDNAHGTHVAGTIGAEGNNTVGVVGVTQNVQMISCKFLGTGGTGSTSDAIQCLQYFSDLKNRAVNPVNIIATNNSWTNTIKSIALEDAIKAHRTLGILFVAAAGNTATNIDVTPYYPAAYEVSNVLSVAATDDVDALASFSNYGRRTVHVGAPGVRILSTVLNQSYASFSGTSMATPHVTGLAAILKSHFPSASYLTIKNLIISSGTSIASLENTTVTGKRIRAADINGTGALTCSNQIVQERLKPATSTVNIVEGQNVLLTSLHVNCDQPGGTIVLYSDGTENVILQDAGTSGDVFANDGIYSLLWQPSNPGSYALDFGNSDIVTVEVAPAPLVYKGSTTTYQYETITGTSLGVGDETIHTVSVPFPIKFNNDPVGFQTIYVASNGTVSFTTNTNPGYLNRTLPTTVANNLIAAHWDDLIPSGSNSNVYVATTGTAPNRKFVVEWRNMRHYNATGLGTFQAVFYENSSDIRFNYLDTNFNSATYNSGKSATVGVQTNTTLAAQYSYNLANVPSLSSLIFRLE